MNGQDIKSVFDLHDELRRNRNLCGAAALAGFITCVLAYHATFLRGDPEPKYEMLAIGATVLFIAGASLFPLTEREKRMRGDVRRQNLLTTLSALDSNEARSRYVKGLVSTEDEKERDRNTDDIITLYDYRCIDGICVRHTLGGEDSDVVVFDAVHVMRRVFSRDLPPLSDETELNDKILDVIDATLHAVENAERRRKAAQLGNTHVPHDDIERGVRDTRARLNAGMPHKGYDNTSSHSSGASES